MNDLFKAIGGVRVKKVMLSLFERTHQGEKDAFYRMKISFRVQKLSQFEDRKFRCISYKKDGKNQFFYFTFFGTSFAMFVLMS